MKNTYETKMKKLQTEYNRLHDRMGYMRNEANIAAANRELDRIVEKMNALIESK